MIFALAGVYAGLILLTIWTVKTMSQALDTLTAAVADLSVKVDAYKANPPTDGATAAELQTVTDQVNAITANIPAPAA